MLPSNNNLGILLRTVNPLKIQWQLSLQKALSAKTESVGLLRAKDLESLRVENKGFDLLFEMILEIAMWEISGLGMPLDVKRQYPFLDHWFALWNSCLNSTIFANFKGKTKSIEDPQSYSLSQIWVKLKREMRVLWADWGQETVVSTPASRYSRVRVARLTERAG